MRDAAARLPGGEGSRADVCELLKESQYVIDGVNDVQISQVASGALPHISPVSRLYLAYISPHLAGGQRRAPPYLAISRLYLAYISPTSRLHLAHISPYLAGGQRRARPAAPGVRRLRALRRRAQGQG